MRINPALDAAALAACFSWEQRLQIVDFLLADDAARLSDDIAARADWKHVINAGNQVYEIARPAFDAMPPEQSAAIDRALAAEAAHEFRFRYDAIRVPDAESAWSAEPGVLAAFVRLMNRRSTLDLLAQITECDDLSFADCQATRYRAGDFLTSHDDDVAGKNRRLAYVLSLTRDWRPEWGGLLLFHGSQATIAKAMVPRFNALSLFRVPQPHSVSTIAPYAGSMRLSLTGWLRSGERPRS